VLFALPSFLIPLGLPTEGDAADYRVPLLQWMLRHRAYPNLPWTMVDDYPMLGELLMLPLYAIAAPLARLVPLAGFLALGAAGGALTADLDGGRAGLPRRTVFLAGFAWVIALRPLALQTTILLVDDLAAAWLLWSLVYALRARAVPAGAFLAAALATRYTFWGVAPLIPLLCALRSGRKLRSFTVAAALGAAGALPFVVRNLAVNHGHPLFPVDAPETWGALGVGGFGRGRDLLSFLLLPFDLLYTNTFTRGLFDYTLGKPVFVHLGIAAAALLARAKGPAVPADTRARWLTAAFALAVTLVWFRASQQLRFLAPVLAIATVGLVVFSLRKAPRWFVALGALAGVFTAWSVEKDAIAIALGKKENEMAVQARAQAECLAKAGARQDVVGVPHRDGTLGFLDRDFVYLPGNPYHVPGASFEAPPWVLSREARDGYEPWPREEPCLLRLVQR
jgi:hypothetical protein